MYLLVVSSPLGRALQESQRTAASELAGLRKQLLALQQKLQPFPQVHTQRHVLIASFPGLPRFFFLFFGLRYYVERKPKNKKKRG